MRLSRWAGTLVAGAVAALFLAWGVFLLVRPPEAGRWIGALLVGLALAVALPTFVRRRAS